jgi:predicted PurR-regulated permease PerM
MESKKVPRGLAVFICLLGLLLFIAAIGALVGWQVSALLEDVALIKSKFFEITSKLQQSIFYHFGISLSEQSQLLKNQQSSVTAMIESLAGSLSSVGTGAVLTFVYVYFLLYYRTHIKSFILQLSPSDQQQETEQVILRAANVSQQYLVGMAKMIVCLWIMYGIGFSILGVKNAIFFAVLCGLLEIVPFIGNITGTVITVLVTTVNGGSPAMLGGIVVTYGIVQLIQGWVLESLILGPQVKINPLFTIIALVIGNIIWGIPGIVLAIPLMAMFKILCDHIDSLKSYGFLIGETSSATSTPGFITKIKTWITKIRRKT